MKSLKWALVLSYSLQSIISYLPKESLRSVWMSVQKSDLFSIFYSTCRYKQWTRFWVATGERAMFSLNESKRKSAKDHGKENAFLSAKKCGFRRRRVSTDEATSWCLARNGGPPVVTNARFMTLSYHFEYFLTCSAVNFSVYEARSSLGTLLFVWLLLSTRLNNDEVKFLSHVIKW